MLTVCQVKKISFFLDFHMQTVQYIWNELKECEIHKKEWVFEAASSITELQNRGSFLQVLLQRINPFVEEALANIIRVVDQNYNLSLIDPDKCPPSYLTHFWITAFANSLIFDLKASLKNHNQQQYGYHCQFPFSGVIQHAVQVLIKEHQVIKSG